jgi:hypothetical protein
MDNIKITIGCNDWPKDIQTRISKNVQSILDEASTINILSTAVKEVIITDNYVEKYNQIAKEWGLYARLSLEAEYLSMAKLCFNKNPEAPAYTILLDSKIFNLEIYVDTINTFLLMVCADEKLPQELRYPDVYRYLTPTSDIARNFFHSLFSSLYAQLRLDIKNRGLMAPPISVDDIVSPFKRRVKRLHLQHQDDLDFERCVILYYDALASLLSRITEIGLYKVDFSEFKEFEPSAIKFWNGLLEQSLNITNKQTGSLRFLGEVIKEISEICFFKITDSPYNIKVADSPKNLFPELVDTHNRIVAFVDVLGFSNMIKHFDQNDDINLLKDLKQSLDGAITQMNTYFNSSENVDTKLFSDCLCLSVPYFENNSDFSYQFAMLMLGIKTYQSLMLQKGYLVRGGVSIGSYYSDKNMIFSGALVEAVEYEKNGSTKGSPSPEKFPRIIIAPRILEKLENKQLHRTLHHYFIDGLIADQDGEIFINPVFNLSISENVWQDAFGVLNDVTDDLSNMINPMLEFSKSTISCYSTPEIQTDYIDQLLKQIRSKVDLNKDQPFAKKYIWTEEFLVWFISNKRSDRFSIKHISFNIVDSWDEEE